MDRDIIEQLKNNRTRFDLLSGELRTAVERLPRPNNCLEYWRGGALKWATAGTPTFQADVVYRLRPDYEPEPEIVECEIRGHMYVCEPHRGKHTEELYKAAFRPDFIGFKFKDGTVFASPIKYSVPGVTPRGYYAQYDDLVKNQALAHHAIAVLFRKS